MIDPPETAPIIETKQYRRFAEFCDACKRYRYIGLCYGVPGVGKSVSARHYAQWSLAAPYIDPNHPVKAKDIMRPPAEVMNCDTAFYTPTVANRPTQISRHIALMVLWHRHASYYASFVAKGQPFPEAYVPRDWPEATKLLIVDEADRLKLFGLEQLRDIFDRDGPAIILVGMPGLEKRMARYPQLYSRVGFVHEFKPLADEEVRFTLEHKWKHLGLSLKPDDFTDAEAVAAVLRITGGNFRLLHRLLAQVERILEINNLRTVTREVVDAARDHMVIGTAA